MNRNDVTHSDRMRGVFQVFASFAAGLLLLPFVVLAVGPMLLVLAPVALVGIPFIVPAMLSGSLAAHSEQKRRERWKSMPRVVKAVH